MRRNIVVLGGGGGASVVLEAVPDTHQRTAIIAVTDTGRSTGLARQIGGDMPAPGDIRSTIAATARNRTVASLLQHRFDGTGAEQLAGMALGNLMLAAHYREYGDFALAVADMAQWADCEATVLPVATYPTQLCARLLDGSDCIGEVAVRTPQKAPIAQCRLEPPVPALPAVVDAIRQADEVIIGPGSFYTTVHAVLLPDGVRSALAECTGRVTFVANTTTQTGQTEHLDVVGHVVALLALLGSNVLDAVILNTHPATLAQHQRLAAEGLVALVPTEHDIAQVRELGVQVYAQPLVERDVSQRQLWNKQDTLRHDPLALREVFGMMGILATTDSLMGGKGATPWQSNR